MGEFLAGNDLSRKVKEVVKGDSVRCAVAFWGRGADAELFCANNNAPNDMKIVCDVSMGGTNPDTLRALGAPQNKKIKSHDGLHSKVYISSAGAIIGSANASNNGIGFLDNGALHLEAGVFVEKNSVEWTAASKWFNKLFASSQLISTDSLELCERRWKSRAKATSAFYMPNLAAKFGFEVAIQSHPEFFGDLGFVFTRNAVDAAVKDEALYELGLQGENWGCPG